MFNFFREKHFFKVKPCPTFLYLLFFFLLLSLLKTTTECNQLNIIDHFTWYSVIMLPDIESLHTSLIAYENSVILILF